MAHQAPARRDARLVGPAWAPPAAYKPPAFGDWADPITDQLAQLQRRPEPCPLCGHPTNDCTHHLAGPVVVDLTPHPTARSRPQEDTDHG